MAGLVFRRCVVGAGAYRHELVLFLAAFGAQYAIGAIIDLFPTDPGGGYHPTGYQVGFGVFLAAQFLALIWYLLGRGSLMAAARR